MDFHQLDTSLQEDPSATKSTMYRSSLMQSATSREPLGGHGECEVILRDFLINCLPEDATNPALDKIMVAVYGFGEEDTPHIVEKINPTTWRYYREIRLHSCMDELMLYIRPEGWDDDIGYVNFSKGALAAFMEIVHKQSIELEREFEGLEEYNPPLTLRFTLVSQKAYISSEIFTQQSNVGLTPDEHADMAWWLNDIGVAFRMRFKRAGKIADIKSAVSMHQRAIELTLKEHADMPLWLSSLSLSLWACFKRTGDLENLEDSITLDQQAIEFTPEGHEDMPERLFNFGVSLCARFDHTGNLADLENAISTQQMVISLTPKEHPNMPPRLSGLGLSFHARFHCTGNLGDLEKAISIQQRAVDLTPEGHTSMSMNLNNLGYSLQARFNHSGNLADLESMISILQRAVDLAPEGCVDMPTMLNNLAVSLCTCFKRIGNLEDLENSIYIQQQAINLTPEGHIDMPIWLNNLGASFQTRFDYTSNLADLENAIYIQQQVINLTPEGHTHMALWFNNLGTSYHTRFSHTGNLADLEHAIFNQQRAVNLTPEGHSNMPIYFNNLGLFFQACFNCTGNLADLKNAISIKQRTVDLTPEGHADMPLGLNNLGNSFYTSFNCTGNLEDLENAISTHHRAIDLAPDGHVNNSTFLMCLADSLHARYMSSHNMEDIDKVLSLLHSSAIQITGNPSIRLTAARKWAQYSRVYDRSQLLDAFSVAIQLLSQVAGLEQTVHKRHQILIDVSNVTASATAAAIDENELETALSWLEQGRCLVWNQINYLRVPTEDVRLHNPSLTDRFLHVAHALEVSGFRQEQHGTFSSGNMTKMISSQEEVNNHVHLAKEWNELLREIRCIPEFQDFLQPPQAFKLLRRLPPEGPIVIFNIDEDRCDALALNIGVHSPVHIPLKTFSLHRAIQLRDEMRQYLTNRHVRQRHESDRGTFRLDPRGVAIIYEVLRELWEDVTKPIFDALAYSPRHYRPPRIWWCPTGPLAFLPIHAAGIYNKEGPPGPCVSDYVVSSYTPTIKALLDKIKAAPTRDIKPTSVLIISQPSTPGQSSIPGAKIETQALNNIIGPPLKSLLLENASATVSRVKEEMKSHGWVHFACHATQDAAEPLKSGFQLHDGLLEVLEIMKQNLPNADLAFLSACQTSTGDEQLADEVVHLAAGMLTAGYRSVVATMWSIQDRYGPIIAKDFYEHILAENSANGRLDGANAARALHHATQELRKELGDTDEALLTWVPYVHFGV